MQKIINFFLFFIGLLIVASCTTKSHLATPILKYEDYELSWNEIKNASSYDVYDGNNFYTNTLDTKINLNGMSEGNHMMKVKAISSVDEFLDSHDGSLLIEISYQIVVTNTKYQVFMINDTHGAFSDRSFPSIARVASIVDDLSLDTIKIMNGDAFQGSYESNMVHGLSILDALNQMAFDCFVIGNHEFDWGLDEIRKYKDGDLSNGEANFPFLGCNIIDKRTNQMVDFLEPYYIKEVDGLKIGVIGLIGYNLESSIMAKYVEDYEFVYPLELIKKYTSELKNVHGCSSVIVSIHDYDEELNNSIANLKGLYQIDGIFCGHTHEHIVTSLNGDGYQIPVVQNQSQNKTALLVKFDIENHTYDVTTYYPSNYAISNHLLTILETYEDLTDQADFIIKKNNSYISRATLGQIAVEQMKQAMKVDVAMMNTAGIRNYISGDITYGAIFEVFPFDNRIITLTLKGSALKSLYESNGDYLYISSFNFNRIDKNKDYDVAVIDYVFFSPYYHEFKNVEYNYTEILLRDLMVEYYKQ